MKRILFIFLLSISIQAIAQQKAKAWDAAIIAKANTAKDEKYLSKTEKEVILYLNLLRLNPKLFGETFLKRYLDSTKENDSYTKSLLKSLPTTKPLPELQASKELWDFAKSYAIKCGKENKTGHGNYAQRIKSISANYGGAMAENCDYGNNKAIDIIMSWLIDEGVKSLGHRENMLDPEYKFVGTSIQPHKGYEWNCVMDFGK